MPRLVDLKCSPESEAEFSNSDGYLLYSTLLSSIEEHDSEASQHIHDSELSSISVSSLDGRFKSSERPHHKRLLTDEAYRFKVGVTDPTETEIFQALVRPLVLGDGKLRFTEATLSIDEFRSTETEFDDLLAEAGSYDDPSLRFNFRTPTAIQFGTSSVTEMFPHRTAVFTSLLTKWNRVCPEELEIDLTREEVGKHIIEKPDARSYRTHSVVTNRVHDQKKGHERPIFKQGFTGRCTYEPTSDAPADVQNAATTLTLFAEYSGVGSAVARGCGAVEVEIDG